MEYNSHRALTNTTWSVLGYGWPILFSLLITPIVVTSLGIREYGIYTFFNTVISLLGLLDLGVGTAVNKYLAEYYGQKDTEKMKVLLGTALTIFSGIGIIGLVVFIFGSYLPMIDGSFAQFANYHWGILAAGATFAIASITSIYGFTFSALQRFDISSKIGMTSLAIQQISILVLVISGYSINAIFAAQLVITLISFLVQKHIAQKILPELPKKLLWNVGEAIKCYKFGLITFINNISTSSLTYLDRLIMPLFLGPSNLT
jgi:O-antigen/teichoic acid export membrane protein